MEIEDTTVFEFIIRNQTVIIIIINSFIPRLYPQQCSKAPYNRQNIKHKTHFKHNTNKGNAIQV